MAKGNFYLVRSDKHVIPITKAKSPYLIGRDSTLPSGQCIKHKYVSRHHLVVVWDDQKNVLLVGQLGKNPTFVAHTKKIPSVSISSDETIDSEKLLAAVLSAPTLTTFVPSQTAVEPSFLSNGSVQLPFTNPTLIHLPPSLDGQNAASLSFPPELGLPVLEVRYEGVQSDRACTAADLQVPASISLAVPTVEALEEEEGMGATGAPTSSWKGILDDVLQQQQQQASRQQYEAEHPEPTPTATAPPQKKTPKAPTPAPPPKVLPFGTDTKKEKSPFERKDPAPPPEETTQTTVSTATPLDQPPVLGKPDKKEATPTAMGFWQWKCHANGKDSDPKSWKKYSRAVAELLEKAYVGKEVTVKIPDSLLKNDPNEKGSTYSVCFAEKSLKGAMIQYQNDDPGKFRLVQRKGGPEVDRKRIRAIGVLPSSSESDYSVSDYSDESGTSTESDSISSSSSDSDEPEEEEKNEKVNVH